MKSPNFNRPENGPINPVLLAEKLRRVENFEAEELRAEIEAEPRFREALWFLQWVSRSENYAGGIKRFVADLVDASQDLIGTDLMASLPAGGQLNEGQLEAIFLSMPDRFRWTLEGFQDGPGPDAFLMEPEIEPLPDYLAEHQSHESAELRRYRQRVAEERRAGQRERERNQREARAKRLRESTRADLVKLCNEVARKELVRYLVELCELPHVRFTRQDFGTDSTGRAPWYFVRVAEALLRFMDRWAEREREMIAETSNTREIFKWLDKARANRKAIVIEAESRHGKTQAVKAWCRMRPGAARLMDTPPAGAEADFLRALARCLGIEVRPNMRPAGMREDIEFVLRASGLMIAFDEFHYCFPSTVSRNTSPVRLNFVRSSIMDAGLPCAFVYTPQSYHGARARFVKVTGYALQQFEERILRTVRLPDEVPREDLAAITRFYLPEVREDLIQLIVLQAIDTRRNYISDAANIAALALDYAKDAGAAAPGLAHVLQAIEDVLPGRISAVQTPASAPVAIVQDEPARDSFSRSATPMQAARRDVAPALPGSRLQSQQASPEAVEADA